MNQIYLTCRSVSRIIAYMNKNGLFNKDFAFGFVSCLCLFFAFNTFSCGRTLSRFGFGDQVQKLPKDFKSMVSVGFHKDSAGTTIKDLTYEAQDGHFRSVEYKDNPFSLEGSIRWERQN